MSNEMVEKTNNLIEQIGGYPVLFSIAVKKAGGVVEISVDDLVNYPSATLELVPDSGTLRFVTTGEDNE